MVGESDEVANERRVFLSWSGKTSKAVAVALRDFLSAVDPTWQPWVSDDISAGERWGDQVSRGLARSCCGILCLTQTNCDAPWLMFEAGALANAVETPGGAERAQVIPLLIDASLTGSQLPAPLQQFQALSIAIDDDDDGLAPPENIRRLVHALCDAFRQPVDAVFRQLDQCWSKAGSEFLAVLSSVASLPAHVTRPIHIGPFSEIYHDIRGSLEHVDFCGDVYIYNIELITLQASVLWDFFFAHPGVRSVKLALQRHVCLRLERQCMGSVARTLRRGAGKLQIYPVHVPREWRGQAFGYFRFSETAKRDNDVVYRMFKMTPDSHITRQGGETVYRYTKYTRISPHAAGCEDLVGNQLRVHFENTVQGRAPLDIDDIEAFNAVDDERDSALVVAEHGLQEEHARKLAAMLPAYPVAIDKHGVDGVERSVERLISERRLHAMRPWKGATEERPKQRMLWAPPWGLPRWKDVTSTFDAELDMAVDDIDIWHARYAQATRRFTFTGAQRDITNGILALSDAEADANGTGLEPLVVTAVSVNAYAAVCAVRQCLEQKRANVRALVLVASAVDLFDAVDAFRVTRSGHEPPIHASEMFTRKFYRAKPRHTAPVIKDLSYFNAPVGTHHLLDLRVRGRSHCSVDFLRRHLDDLVHDYECKIYFVHSERDQMTPISQIHELVRALEWAGEVSLVEAPIYHDVIDAKFELNPLFGNQSEMARLIETVYKPLFGGAAGSAYLPGEENSFSF